MFPPRETKLSLRYTDPFATAPPEKLEGMMGFMSKLAAYAPSFERQATVDEAIPLVISTWEKASIETGYGGSMVSQYGNKQWL